MTQTLEKQKVKNMIENTHNITPKTRNLASETDGSHQERRRSSHKREKKTLKEFFYIWNLFIYGSMIITFLQ